MSTVDNSQNSIISYVPQPFFYAAGGQTCDVSLAADSTLAEWESVENADGIFDPDLSKAATFITANNNQGADLGKSLSFSMSFGTFASGLSNMRSTMTVGLIGCSLFSYADDGGSPNLETEREEFMTFSISTTNLVKGSVDSGKGFAYNSNNKITTFCQDPRPSIISGGQANLLISGLGEPVPGAIVSEVQFDLHAARIGRKHLKLTVGHLFVGIDLPVQLDPRSFAWNIRSKNDSHESKDFGSIRQSGTLVRSASGEIINIPYYNVNGSEIRNIHSDNLVETLHRDPSFFDLVKFNTSYPLLLIPYPTTPVSDNLTEEQFALSGRQNFFSIYGYLDGDMQLQTGKHRDGLNTDYRMKFRVKETR